MGRLLLLVNQIVRPDISGADPQGGDGSPTRQNDAACDGDMPRQRGLRTLSLQSGEQAVWHKKLRLELFAL